MIIIIETELDFIYKMKDIYLMQTEEQFVETFTKYADTRNRRLVEPHTLWGQLVNQTVLDYRIPATDGSELLFTRTAGGIRLQVIRRNWFQRQWAKVFG